MEQSKESKRQGGPGMMDSGLLCAETTNAGDPCPSPRMSESEYCFWHDPLKAEEQDAARAKGGEAGGRKRKYVQGTAVPITSLQDVLDGLGEVIGNLKQMDQSVPTMNSLIRAYQVASSCFLEQHDREQLEKEMNELRKALGLVGEFGE